MQGYKGIGMFKKRMDYTFNTDFIESYWELWKEYRKEQHGFEYKSTSERFALKKLYSLSEGRTDKAEKIIEQSIENGWKGLFKVQEETGIKDLGFPKEPKDWWLKKTAHDAPLQMKAMKHWKEEGWRQVYSPTVGTVWKKAS